MIINHAHRFVFVDVPKNAGTSVTEYLGALTTYRDLVLDARPDAGRVERRFRERFGLGIHATAARIREVMGASDFAAYRIIAVQRDPYERVRSLHAFLHEWTPWRDRPWSRAHLEEWESLHEINDFVRSRFFATEGPGRVFERQTRWLCSPADGEMLVDIRLRLETLEADLRALPERLGLPADALDGSVPHLNATVPSSAVPLDAASRSIIRERYREDFERLGDGIGGE